MGSLSIWHWIVVLLLLLPLWFFSRAIARAGFAPWWALLGIIPVLNIIMLWVFAYISWPAFSKRQ